MGVSPLAGHDFDTRTASGGAIAAIVNQRLASALWPGQPAIGRTLRLASYPRPIVIAGVAPDGLYSGYRRQSDPNFVLVSANDAPPNPGQLTLYARYTGALADIVPAVGRALRTVDDRAPIVYVRTMEDQLASLTWPLHALTMLLTLFAVGSLLIAALGQYAAMAFTMRRRIRDFGIRIALGASTSDIIAGVVREGLGLTVAGLAIGLVLSL